MSMPVCLSFNSVIDLFENWKEKKTARCVAFFFFDFLKKGNFYSMIFLFPFWEVEKFNSSDQSHHSIDRGWNEKIVENILPSLNS